jgi:putative ABC transport system permease protein
MELGGVEQVKEQVRERRSGVLLDTLLQDVRYAARTLVRSSGFTFLAVSTLALGIGVNVAVLTVAYGILLHPLPYPDSSRLVIVSQIGPDGTDLSISPGDLRSWLERLRTVIGAAAYHTRELTVRGGGEPHVVRTAYVTDRFFDVLGVAAQQGHTTNLAGSAGAVVASRLANQLVQPPPADSIGRRLTVGTGTYTVAGVMPAAFAFPSEDVQVWVPAPPFGTTPLSEAGQYRVLARLKPDVTVQQFRDDAARVFRELKGQIKGPKDQGAASVTVLDEAVFGPIRPVLHVSVAAGFLVLIVACANVTTLFIGRAVTRRREVTTRMALGAGPMRLVRSVAIETGLLATAGSIVGIGLAIVALRLFVKEAAGVLPRLGEVGVDLPIVVAIAGLTLVVTLLCGAIPAWQVAHSDVRPFLRTSSVTTPIAWRIRASLVVGQIALSIVLLIGAVLLTRTVISLLRENPGFEPSGAFAVKLVLSDVTLFDGATRASFTRELLQRVRALPGVQDAGLGSTLPPRRPPITIGIRFIGDHLNEFRFIKLGSATPGYVSALGARLLSGRDFEEADARTDQGTVIISESAAHFFFPGQEAVGRVIPRLPPIVGPATTPRVVGVVRDIKYEGLDVPPGSAVYLPWERRPIGTAYLIVRAAGDPMRLAPSVRRVIADLDPSVPVPEVRSLEEVLAESISDRRLRVMPAAGFALLALAVALVGLLGTLSRAVAERRQELAIRAALGASPRELISTILMKGAALTGLGLVLGLAGAMAVGRGLARLLYGVSPYDLTTFGAVALCVGIGSMGASYLPARRAARIDPVVDLRYE